MSIKNTVALSSFLQVENKDSIVIKKYNFLLTFLEKGQTLPILSFWLYKKERLMA
jgi:hypothetical protein